jgi:hypothetical protein
VMKTNYSLAGQAFELIWNAGRYIPYTPAVETDDDKAEVEAAVIEGMTVLAGRGENVSPKPRAPNYVVKALRGLDCCRAFVSARVESAVNRLQNAGRIRSDTYKTKNGDRERLVLD